MNLKQQTFITEYLRHRSAYTAYCIAYRVQDETKYDSIMSSANRLLNHPEVGGVIDNILKGIRHDVEQEIRAELKTDLLTLQRKREILAKIATGEFYAVHNYKGKDCNMCTQHVWPTINQVLKAIDLDNKMAGLYTTAQATHKPQTAPSLNKQVAEQVDKFLKSVGIVPGQIENSSFEGGAAGGGCPLAEVETTDTQQHSEAVSLQPIKKTSNPQQTTTTTQKALSPGEGWERLQKNAPAKQGHPKVY